MKFSIRLLYLYLFAFIGLLVSVIGSIQLVDLGINIRQRQTSTALAMLIVGLPLYKYHWRLISHRTGS